MEWVLTPRFPLLFLALYTFVLLYHAWVGHRETQGAIRRGGIACAPSEERG